MAATAALVGGSFLSAFLQVLFDRLASRNFLSFCKGQSLNDKLLKKLLTLLNSVNGLLDDAEEKEIIKPSVEKWLNDLKDAVYEADDLLDEIGYESLKLESESRIQTNPRKNPFRKFIEEKLKDVLERLQDLVNQKDALGLREVGVGGGVKRASFHRIPSTSLVQECDVYGRDADKQAIIHWLLSDDPKGNDLGVILIVGMGGIGKTTLAQLVYNDESIRDRFGLQAWVCVSEEYDVFRLTKDMIEEVSRRPCDINSLNQLQLELKRILKGHRFLLILDDVWIDDVGTWEMLRMPFMSGAKGSKIIVTTRNQNVASLMGTRSIYSLNQLDTNDCWLLFAKQAFGDEFGEHPQLEVVGREIAADLFVSVGLLKHLRYLNLSGTPIERLFDSVGSLYNLQTLILNDCIGKGSGSTIKELGQLHHLHGSLTVWNLQFVDNVQDVCVANLKGKKCLKSLKLVWKGDTFDSLQERAVLEQLQPNKNLECLSIIGYGGTKFPSWLGDSLFSTITSVELRECKHCSSLPPFGQLVSLTSLSIVACDAVVTVGSEFYGSSPMRRDPFISLKTLRIEKMQQWQEWNTATDGSDIGAFPILEQLYLTDCPNLTKALPRKLPYLETLVIEGCQQLDMATIPSNQTTYKMHLVDDYRDVWLNRCAAVRPHHLEIARFFCQSPVEGMELVTGVSSSLEEIEICRSDSLVYFPLHMFPKLKTLSIRYSASLKHLSEAVDSTICREASSLDSLEVCNCPNLVSFPRGGLLAPNMTQLLLQSCSKLKSLPEKRMLPSSLTSLEISDLHNLKFLNTRCFQQLASLGRLKIKNCPQLQYIREDKFPPSLHLLSIVMCPLLRQRFQPENGELWPMISHIRDVFIY
ncbi:Putative disease resistance RPP13-like protein 1 [Linum perenne]